MVHCCWSGRVTCGTTEKVHILAKAATLGPGSCLGALESSYACKHARSTAQSCRSNLPKHRPWQNMHPVVPTETQCSQRVYRELCAHAHTVAGSFLVRGAAGGGVGICRLGAHIRVRWQDGSKTAPNQCNFSFYAYYISFISRTGTSCVLWHAPRCYTPKQSNNVPWPTVLPHCIVARARNHHMPLITNTLSTQTTYPSMPLRLRVLPFHSFILQVVCCQPETRLPVSVSDRSLSHLIPAVYHT